MQSGLLEAGGHQGGNDDDGVMARLR